MSNPCEGCPPESENDNNEPEEPKTSFNLYQCVHGHFFLFRPGKEYSDKASVEHPNKECYRTQQLVYSEDILDSFLHREGYGPVLKAMIAEFLSRSGKK